MEFAAGLALQAAAPPLIAFTLYFCLLHAPRHMAALPQAATGWQAAPVSLAAVAIIAAGICASLGGPPATTLGSPPAAGFSAWLNAAAATGLLWGLACLTLPHVVLGHLARRLHAIPIRCLGHQLIVAVTDNNKTDHITAELRKFTDMQLRFVLADVNQIGQAISVYYDTANAAA